MFEHFTDKALRIDDYLNLIQALLSCPRGEERNILNVNRELLDAGLVQVMEQAAVVMAEKGYQNEPRFLRSFAEGIAASIGYSSPISSAEIEESLNFFLRVVNEVISSNNNPQVVFPLLIANMNKLDRHLAQILRVWAKFSFPLVTIPQAQSAALWIAGFGGLVKDFPQGDRESNLEIAIASFESSLQVLTGKDFPRQWSAIQDNLGNVYRKRIDGENSENIKKAIVCYQLALQVRTKYELPEQWAMTQFNLGQAYILYMEGDRIENLEKAMICYENALQVYTPDQFPKEARMAQDNLEFTRQELRNIGLTESPEQALQPLPTLPPAEQNFLLEVLRAIWRNEQNLQSLYPLLQANLSKLDINFAQILRIWATNVLDTSSTNRSQNIATVIYHFSNLMQNFPLGNRAANLEIAITGYEIVRRVYTCENFPQHWAELQINLGIAYEERLNGNQAEKWEQAIACYENAARVFTRKSSPEKWASIQENLGNAYRNRVYEQKEENLERASQYHQNALQVFTPDTNPQSWGVSQHNLGRDYLALSHLDRSDRKQCLESAIEHYEQALQTLKREVDPDLWAMNQLSLGNAYSDRLQGNPYQNYEKAQRHYENALSVYTPSTNSAFYQLAKAGQEKMHKLKTGSNSETSEESSFIVQVLKLTLASDGDPKKIFPFLEENLDQLNQNFIDELISFISDLGKENNQADIYPSFMMGINIFSGLMMTFPKGSREINLDIAIAGWKIVLPYQNYDLPSDFSDLCGIIQLELGKAFYEKYENRWGALDVNLEEAIKYFEEGFAELNSNDTLDRELYGELRVSCQVKLGISYFNRNKIKGDPDDIEKAIKAYNLVILSDCQENTLQWWVQMNLGNAYCRRQGDPLENLITAIECYENSLKVCKQDTDRTKWADVQINLGQAYYRRGLLGRSKGAEDIEAEDIESAIECNNNALKVYNDKTKYPQRWDGLQNALGIYYSDRRQGNYADNLEKAIDYFNQSLTVRTQQAYPYEWAETQRNLGLIYLQRKQGGRGDRIINLRLGIKSYERALEVFDSQKYPVAWAETHACLATIYRVIAAENIDTKENLKKAITYATNAERQFRNDPLKWARVQFELGTCYKNLAVFAKENPEENLANAIKCYQNAINLTSCKSNPFSWAEFSNSLGNAYQHNGQYQEAIKCFEDTLKLHTRAVFPTNYIKTKINLANAHGKNNQLENAFKDYKEAIDILEDLLSQLATDDDAKRKLGEEWFKAYQYMVAACLKLGKQNSEYYATAWEYVERSKARRLVEIFGQTKPDGVSEKNWKNFQDLRNQVTNEQKWIEDQEKSIFLSGESLSEPGELDSRKIRLIDMKQQLNQKITDERKLADTQRVQYTLFSEIGKNLSDDQDDHTVIIQWYLLEADNKFCAFIYTRQNSQPYVWESSLEDLKNLEQWYQEYFENYISNFSQWKDKLSDQLKRLAEILHIDELLKYLPKNCQQLILIPHRYLHLLPIHSLPLNDGTYLLDFYSKGINYYPSFQLLQMLQNKTFQNQRYCNFDNLFAIQNPENNLPFTDVEVATILSLFSENSTVLVGEKATKNNFDEYDKLPSTHCCHFSCHGEFNYESPLESALRLANNERLTLADIFKLNLHQCRLVTLSACETGLTDFNSITDEYIGLPSGFLYAGASTVVSSLWAVSDISTAFLFIKFYENLKNCPEPNKRDVAFALKNAQKWLRNLTNEEGKNFLDDNIKPHIQTIFKQEPILAQLFLNGALTRINAHTPHPFSHPYNWAAFTTTGF